MILTVKSFSTAKRRFKAPFMVLLLALSLLLPGVLPPPVAFAAGGLNLDLFLGTYDGLKAYASGDPNPTQKLDYWSGESVPAVAQIAASGEDSATAQDVALTLTVPKVRDAEGKLLISTPAFVDSELAVQAGGGTARSETEDAWILTYTFPSMKGGQFSQLPFNFSFLDGITPNGTTVTPTIELKVGEVTTDTKSLTFTAKSADANQVRQVFRRMGEYLQDNKVDVLDENNQKIGVTKFYSDTRTDHTPAAGLTTYFGVCTHSSKAASTSANQGNYQYHTMTYDVTLPEGADAVETLAVGATLNHGWAWVDDTHRVMRLIRSYESNWAVCEKNNDHYDYELIYRNAPTVDADGSAHRYTPVVHATADMGLATERDAGTAQLSHIFVEQVVPFNGTSRVVQGKALFGHSYENWHYDNASDGHLTIDGDTIEYTWVGRLLTRMSKVTGVAPGVMASDEYPEDLPGFRWALEVGQDNNGSSYTDKTGGTHHFVHEVVDTDLDPRLYYQQFDFFSTRRAAEYVLNSNGSALTVDEIKARINATSNHLYGVKRDGTEVEIAKDLDYGDRVAINDTAREYAKLRLVFDTPLELDNYRAFFYVRAFPTDAELAKWNSGYYTEKQLYANYMSSTVTQGSADGQVVQSLKDGTEMWDSQKSNNNAVVWPLTPKVTTRLSRPARADVNPPSNGNPDWWSGPWWTTDDGEATYSRCTGVAADNLTPKTCSRLKTLEISSNPKPDWGSVTRTLKNVRQVLLLPPGVNYVRTDSTQIARDLDATARTPKIVRDYKGTGRTALIYSYGDIDYTQPKYGLSDSVATFVTVDMTLYANFGVNTFDAYTVWDGPESVQPTDDTALIDSLDFDDDGATDDKVSHTTIGVRLIAPSEIISKIETSLNGESDWTLSAPAQDLGSPVYYRLSVMNNSLTPTSTVSLLSVLPSTTDHKIVSDRDGTYAHRDWESTATDGETALSGHSSAFRTPLTGPASKVLVESETGTKDASDRVTVLYSVTEQGTDLASVVNAQWYTAEEIPEHGGWTAVTAVKADLKPGEVLDSKETLRVILPARIPVQPATTLNSNFKDGKLAVASVALAGSGASYVEANDVTVSTDRYSARGAVFRDLNANGVKDAGERFLPDQSWTMVKSDGSEVSNPGYEDSEASGTTVDTKAPAAIVGSHTSTDPTLQLADPELSSSPVYPRGTYALAFTKPDAMSWSPKPTSPGDATVVNSADENGLTDLFDLNPVTRTATRYAGVVGTRDLEITKTAQDTGQAQEGVAFTLTFKGWLDSEAPTQTVNPAQTQWTGTTDANGALTFANLPYGTYTLHEGEPLTGYARVADQTVTIDATGATITGGVVSPIALAVADPRAEGTVTVTKTDDYQQPLAGVAFGLFPVDANGATASTPAFTATTGDDGRAQFTNVPWAKYVLRELSGKDGYVKAEGDLKTFELGGPSFDAGTVVNERIDGTVSVKKVDETGDALAGATFGLFPVDASGVAASVPVMSATSGSDGVATFTNVHWGVYQVKETSAPEGYTLSDTALTVTVDAQHLTVAAGTVTDRPITGTIILTKTSDDGTPLARVEFALYPVTKGPDGSTTVADVPAMRALSDTNGRVSFDSVRYGMYELRETKGLPGYLTMEKPLGVVVTADGATIDLGQVVNTAERGAIRLLKTDAKTGDPLAGATFAIYRVEEDGTVAEEPSDTQVSGADGIVSFENLTVGDYAIRETNAPTGWLVSTDTISAKVSADGQVVDAGRVNNERIRADIIAHKVDSQTHAGLAGATFALEREGQQIATATSDADGLVTFKDVEYGTYTIREERAPRGYALSETRLTAVVSQNGVFVDAGTIENQLVVDQPALARTGMDAEVVGLAGLVGAIGIGLLLGVRRRRVS